MHRVDQIVLEAAREYADNCAKAGAPFCHNAALVKIQDKLNIHCLPGDVIKRLSDLVAKANAPVLPEIVASIPSPEPANEDSKPTPRSKSRRAKEA